MDTVTLTPAVSPCIHPTCRDADGNPRLTRDTMCDGCQNRHRNTITHLVEDYVHLKTNFPAPARRARSERATSRPSYGHPAEWASYTAAEISEVLNDAEGSLRTHLGISAHNVEHGGEAAKVARAYRLITDNFHAFSTMADADVFAEATTDLHRNIRNTLGQNKFVERLPTPCPTCEISALTRDTDRINCGNCGRIITEDEYPHFALMILDNAIAEYDLEHNAA